MNRIQENLTQGTPEWDAFRLNHDGASEAAAAMGLSKKVKRNELLRMKHTGIAKEFSAWVQENILDAGHEVEALARPHIETLIGESLYPVTYSYGRLSASCDGLTADDETAFEHKQYSAGLFEAVRNKELPDEYMPQCQQVMHVTGARRLIFVCSDGTPENMAWMEILPDPDWVHRIEAAWLQFNTDLAEYVPPEVIQAVVAAPQEALPSLSVQVDGAVAVRDNLAVFGDAMRAYIERLNKKPESDQDFADLDASAKLLRDAQAKIKAAKDMALGQVEAIDAMKRTADLLEELARTTAVELEKIVKSEKEARRNAIVANARALLQDHIADLNIRIGKAYLGATCVAENFAGVVKGLKTLDSTQNAVDTELARCKIEVNALADRIEINLRTLREKADGFQSLFPDTAQLVLKPRDDLEYVITARLGEHKAAETKRIADIEERARIAAEAKVKAEAEAQAAKTIQPVAIAAATEPEPPRNLIESVRMANAAADGSAPDTGAKIKLGDIHSRLGFTVTAEFLASLGFTATTDKNARLYPESAFPAICAALVAHINGVANGLRKAA